MNIPNTITSTDLWLAGCKGQTLSPAQQSSGHYAEGSLIRSLFYSRFHGQNEQTNFPTPTELSEQRHWQQILNRSRQEGLFVSTTKPTPQTPPHFGWVHFKNLARNQQWFALVASVAVLGIGLTLSMQHDDIANDNAIIMRGDEAVQRLVVQANKTAAQVARQIEEALQQHQVPYRRAELSDGGIQIQAKVPRDSPARQALLALGLTMPEHERLNLLILKQ